MLELSIFLIGLGAIGLRRLFPNHVDEIALLETIDIWAAVIAASMFATYMLICVGVRLFRHLRHEITDPEETPLQSHQATAKDDVA